MSPIQCFWVQLSGLAQITLRRYVASDERKCPADPGEHSYCNAAVTIAVEPMKWGEPDEDRTRRSIAYIDPAVYRGDTRWPAACARCHTPFDHDDRWQVHQQPLYRAANGREWIQSGLPVGAMFDAFWLNDFPAYTGSDGRALICIVPGHHPWNIDGRASNCTRPGEEHKCWVRHGEPPNLTVDKSGNTCNAGAGSIQTKEWHGFLRNGVLVPC